jgi:hypothetical protein
VGKDEALGGKKDEKNKSVVFSPTQNLQTYKRSGKRKVDG